MRRMTGTPGALSGSGSSYPRSTNRRVLALGGGAVLPVSFPPVHRARAPIDIWPSGSSRATPTIRPGSVARPVRRTAEFWERCSRDSIPAAPPTCHPWYVHPIAPSSRARERTIAGLIVSVRTNGFET